MVQPHLHMIRRCVGFSWAQPLCCEKSNASPCVHSVETSHAVLFSACSACFSHVVLRRIALWFLISHVVLRVALFCVFGVFPSTSCSGASLLVSSPHAVLFHVFCVFMVKMPPQIEKG